ncbi:MAG TPA: thioredoxin family protein [Anaerolineaceae bacterium]
MPEIIHLTDATFSRAIQESESCVLVEFGAIWCSPCRQMEPVLLEYASRYPGVLNIVKVDVDEALETTLKFGVMSVPTFILFSRGEEKQRTSGKQSLARLAEKFDPYIRS